MAKCNKGRPVDCEGSCADWFDCQKESQYFGTFTMYGYEIWCKDAEGLNRVHESGNCRFDSTQTFPTGADESLDLCEIEECCCVTGKDLAKQNNGTWTGCEHDMDAEAEWAEMIEENK